MRASGNFGSTSRHGGSGYQAKNLWQLLGNPSLASPARAAAHSKQRRRPSPALLKEAGRLVISPVPLLSRICRRKLKQSKGALARGQCGLMGLLAGAADKEPLTNPARAAAQLPIAAFPYPSGLPRLAISSQVASTSAWMAAALFACACSALSNTACALSTAC